MAYHKYIACFSNVPFTIPTPYDVNIGKLCGGIPTNTPTTNQCFYDFFSQQVNGHLLQPGDYFRLQDVFYPQTYTCYQYIGTSSTPETYYNDIQGSASIAPSNHMNIVYSDCITCETAPWVSAYHHDWRECGTNHPTNIVNTNPLIFGCPLTNTNANNQYFFDQITAMLGYTITAGDTLQLSDGTCYQYIDTNAWPTHMDVDLTNNPGSGLWHTGFAAGTGGCGAAIPPTRGFLANYQNVSCNFCPSVGTTTTLTTIGPITTTTTTCYNCCTTTTTGPPCTTCGIESCCDPAIQYLAAGNLLTLLNTLQCNSNYAFFLPQLFVGGNTIYDECWRPLCNPPAIIPTATSTWTYADLTSNGWINALGCAGLSSTLPIPCCPSTTTTTVWGPTAT